MYTVSEITEPLNNEQLKDIFALVSQDAHNIGTYRIQKESPFYDYISIREQIRVEHFLNRIVATGAKKTFLIVAENPDGKIIGYLLYNKDVSSPDDLSLCTTVVSETYRRQGVFTEMLALLKTKAKSISLTCFIERVSFYEKFGFKVDEAVGTQIGMCFGAYTGSGLVVGVDDQIIDQNPYVLAVVESIRKKLGPSYNRLWTKLKMESVREANKVEKYIRDVQRRPIS